MGHTRFPPCLMPPTSPPHPASPHALNRWVIALLLTGVFIGHAHAARPMITDDARIVDPGACQLETWTRHDRSGGQENWALPGCNPTGNLEVTIGGASLRPLEGGDQSLRQVQLKSIVRPLTAGDWGWGVALGGVDRSGAEAGMQPYAYLPITLASHGDQAFVHLNLGAQRTVRGGGAAIWGIGTEVTILPRTLLIAESFGTSGHAAQGQVGLRIWVVPNRVQIDTTWGSGMHGTGHWFTFGVRLLSPSFLP